jgi:hypothetical protein
MRLSIYIVRYKNICWGGGRGRAGHDALAGALTLCSVARAVRGGWIMGAEGAGAPCGGFEAVA